MNRRSRSCGFKKFFHRCILRGETSETEVCRVQVPDQPCLLILRCVRFRGCMTSPSALVNSASLFWSLISGTTCKEISGSLSTSLYLCFCYHFGVRDFLRGEGRECLFWIIALWLHFTKGGASALALVTLGLQACSQLFFNTTLLNVLKR